jgi:hypothetical protein
MLFIPSCRTRLSNNSVFCSEPIIREDQNTRTIFGSPVLQAFCEVDSSARSAKTLTGGFFDSLNPGGEPRRNNGVVYDRFVGLWFFGVFVYSVAL